MGVDRRALRQQSANQAETALAKVAELADAPDLGSGVQKACGFNSRPSHDNTVQTRLSGIQVGFGAVSVRRRTWV